MIRTGDRRFTLYSRDSRIIWESWHIWGHTEIFATLHFSHFITELNKYYHSLFINVIFVGKIRTNKSRCSIVTVCLQYISEGNVIIQKWAYDFAVDMV